MGNKTQIQWCDATWNVGVGCTKVDADCKKIVFLQYEKVRNL